MIEKKYEITNPFDGFYLKISFMFQIACRIVIQQTEPKYPEKYKAAKQRAKNRTARDTTIVQ